MALLACSIRYVYSGVLDSPGLAATQAVAKNTLTTPTTVTNAHLCVLFILITSVLLIFILNDSLLNCLSFLISLGFAFFVQTQICIGSSVESYYHISMSQQPQQFHPRKYAQWIQMERRWCEVWFQSNDHNQVVIQTPATKLYSIKAVFRVIYIISFLNSTACVTKSDLLENKPVSITSSMCVNAVEGTVTTPAYFLL